MVSNRIAVGALSLACVAAAGAGGYLATRHNVTPVATPAASVPESATTAAATGPELAAPPDASVPEPVTAFQPPPLVNSPSAARQAEGAAGSTNPIVGRTVAAPSGASRAVSGAEHVRNTRTPTGSVGRAASAPAADRERPAPPAARERTTPESVASAHPVGGASNAEPQPLAARVEALQAETPREPEPAKRPAAMEELVVAADSVIGLQLDTSVNSEQARVEDRVDARVVRDVRVGGSVAVPAGSRAVGTVVVVERGGRFRERARLGIRFHTLTSADGTSLSINTDTIYRLGEGPGTGTAARIGGGAVVGAIIGGIIGGGKGAAIGATTGAGAGTASVMSTDRNVASFSSGSEVTARILSPVTVIVERQ
jgi:hypothetical protein